MLVIFLIIIIILLVIWILIKKKKENFIGKHTLNPQSQKTNCDVGNYIVNQVNQAINQMFLANSPVGDISLTVAGQTFSVSDSLFQNFTIPSFSASNTNPGSTTLLMQPNGNGTLVNPSTNTWSSIQILNDNNLQPLQIVQSGVWYTNVYDRVGSPICSNTFDYIKSLVIFNMSILNFNKFAFSLTNTTCEPIARADQTINFNWQIENPSLEVQLDFQFYGCDGGTGFCGLTWDLQCSHSTQEACPDDQACIVEGEINGYVGVTMNILCTGTGSFDVTGNTSGDVIVSNIQITYGSSTTSLTNDNYTISNPVLALVNVSTSKIKDAISSALSKAVSKLMSKVLPEVVGLINKQLNTQTVTFYT